MITAKVRTWKNFFWRQKILFFSARIYIDYRKDKRILYVPMQTGDIDKILLETLKEYPPFMRAYSDLVETTTIYRPKVFDVCVFMGTGYKETRSSGFNHNMCLQWGYDESYNQ